MELNGVYDKIIYRLLKESSWHNCYN